MASSILMNPEALEDQEEIPVIDFGRLTKGTPDQRLKTIQDLRSAYEDWGFFLLVNHGVPEKMREEMIAKAMDFFELTEEEKAEYTDTHWMNPIRYGTSFNPAVDDGRYWRKYLKAAIHPEFHSPVKPPGLR